MRHGLDQGMTQMQTVAHTILSQLGGNKFAAMTGAGSFASGPDSLSFRFSRAPRNKARACVVKLEADDTYTVKFFKMHGYEVQVVGEFSQIYSDMLPNLFFEETGLEVRL